MSDNDNKVVLLRGIIEADETFIGGRPRRRADSEGNLPPPNKRDRGTKKAKILGAVQRGGRVVARVATDLSHITIFNFIKAFVRIGGSNLMTDEYRGYRPLGLIMHHKFINRAERKYVEGDILPKTIAVAVRSLDHSTQPTNTTSDIFSASDGSQVGLFVRLLAGTALGTDLEIPSISLEKLPVRRKSRSFIPLPTCPKQQFCPK